MRKRIPDLNAAALICGILTGAWGLLWIILCLVYHGTQLDILNSIHPWKIWVVVVVLSFIVHNIALWIKPDMRFRGVTLAKLKLQAQLLLCVLAVDVTWAAIVDQKFYWTLEMGVLAVLELILVMDRNSKGFSGRGISPVTLATLAGTGLMAFLISVFIEPIGRALLFVSLKLKAFLGLLLGAFSGVITFIFTHLKMSAPVTITEEYQQRADYDETEVFSSPNDNAFTFFKYLIYVMLGLIVLLCIAALAMVVIDRIKKLWEYRRETIRAAESTESKTGFFENIAITVKMVIKRVKALLLLNRNRNSVGYALYSLEKKYRPDKKLRRQKGETPAAFIDRIIESKTAALDNTADSTAAKNPAVETGISALEKAAASPAADKAAAEVKVNPDRMNTVSGKMSLDEEIDRLKVIQIYATRAAYDRNFSWLTELP